jgi:adenine-specific DNA methylase
MAKWKNKEKIDEFPQGGIVNSSGLNLGYANFISNEQVIKFGELNKRINNIDFKTNTPNININICPTDKESVDEIIKRIIEAMRGG